MDETMDSGTGLGVSGIMGWISLHSLVIRFEKPSRRMRVIDSAMNGSLANSLAEGRSFTLRWRQRATKLAYCDDHLALSSEGIVPSQISLNIYIRCLWVMQTSASENFW